MPKKTTSIALIPQEIIENKILLIRGKRVMLDRDLAALYGVETRQLTRQVRRNKDRFPQDFMFQLSLEELQNLKCQFGTSSWGGTRKPPYVFTEHGILMLSSVLNSKRAIQVNIAIMRVFVRIKEMIVTHKDLEQKLYELEHKIGQHETDIQGIFEAIRRLMTSPATKPKPPNRFSVVNYFHPPAYCDKIFS
jgi:ORF6N domain